MALKSSCRGSSLVEFAIVMPLFIALVYGTMFLSEVGMLKLKAQEIARFGAFAFSNYELSAFDTPDLEHTVAWRTARAAVSSQLSGTYADLDAAAIGFSTYNQGFLMKPSYSPEGGSSLFAQSLSDRDMLLVPAALNAQFAEPLSALWWALSLTGVGASVQDVFRNVVGHVGMDTMGLVRSRPLVTIRPMENVQRAYNLAAAGKSRGADLTRWAPLGTLRDTRSTYIEMSLLVDPWRVVDGAAVGPRDTTSRYVNAVSKVSKNALAALPGGTLLSILLSANYVQDRLPAAVMSLLGLPSDRLRAAKVMSVPYSKPRAPQAHPTGDPEQGQINIYEYFNISRPDNRVQNFETAPFIDDPEHPSSSDYAEMLNERGPNFMGCPNVQERGCWE